ncbi:MAG: hypothetical protein KBT49_00415, partial [Bacteroidetes bacterium]|nr:hypothetical protein [Candidatus Colenecus caballi]
LKSQCPKRGKSASRSPAQRTAPRSQGSRRHNTLERLGISAQKMAEPAPTAADRAKVMNLYAFCLFVLLIAWMAFFRQPPFKANRLLCGFQS